MFISRASSSSNKKSKLQIFKDPLSEEEREDFFNCASKKEADKYLALSLIQKVNASPLKIQILGRWEKQGFKGLENAPRQLKQLNHVWIDTAYIDGRELYYVDIGLGFLTWNSYNLILQFCREQGQIIIYGDPSRLVQQQWSRWT